MRKKKIRYIVSMAAAMLLLTAGIVFALFLPVSAGSSVINMNISRFGSLTGDAAYINYADNYHLDMEETGLLDAGSSIFNGIANMVFGIICLFGKIVCTLYYYCMEFNLAELFEGDIDRIQRALTGSIFTPLFYLAFCGSAVHMVQTFVKRDMIGSFVQIAKVIGVLILSIMVVRYSSTVISGATDITKDLSTSVLISVNGGETTDTAGYAAQAAGQLWANMIHKPWVYLEFGDDPVSRETIEQFLCVGSGNQQYTNGSDARAELVKNYVGNAFSKSRAGGKVAFAVFYLILAVVKGMVYIALSVLGLAYQLFAIFYALLAPVILLLIMIPSYEPLLSAWLKKLLETQIGILMLSLLTGLLMLVDNLLYERCAGRWGWLVVIAVQAIILVVVITKRNEILNAFGKLQRASGNAGYARAMMQNSNRNMAAESVKTAKTAAGYTVQKAEKMGNAVTAAEIWAAKKGMAAGRQIAGRAQDVREDMMTAEIMRAAGSYEVDYAVLTAETERKVERPVLDPQKVINVKPVDGHLERTAPAAEIYSVQEMRERRRQEQEALPQRQRPRMQPAAAAGADTGGCTAQESVKADTGRQTVRKHAERPAAEYAGEICGNPSGRLTGTYTGQPEAEPVKEAVRPYMGNPEEAKRTAAAAGSYMVHPEEPDGTAEANGIATAFAEASQPAQKPQESPKRVKTGKRTANRENAADGAYTQSEGIRKADAVGKEAPAERAEAGIRRYHVPAGSIPQGTEIHAAETAAGKVKRPVSSDGKQT